VETGLDEQRGLVASTEPLDQSCLGMATLEGQATTGNTDEITVANNTN
jgi:hypothetical protein